MYTAILRQVPSVYDYITINRRINKLDYRKRILKNGNLKNALPLQYTVLKKTISRCYYIYDTNGM
ncbi:MAG TPA: hypothetical protein VN704_10435 [Verrucomicrobiae bacterium]|nr:hypothetical protein [Verrucomicrobiae bacterium]